MATTQYAVNAMREVTKRYIAHYGPDGKKAVILLNSELSKLVFHRAFATPKTTEGTLSNLEVSLSKELWDVLTVLLRAWVLEIDNINTLATPTAQAMTSYRLHAEPPVDSIELANTLASTPVIMAMFYLYHGLVLG